MPTRRPDEEPLRRRDIAGQPHPVEHFLEVLLIAKDRAANETVASKRRVWQATIRDIETVLADDMLEVVGARNMLAQRSDQAGQNLYACACELVTAYEAADRETIEAIERARKG